MVENKDTLNNIFTDVLHRITNTVKTIMYFQRFYKNLFIKVFIKKPFFISVQQ